MSSRYIVGSDYMTIAKGYDKLALNLEEHIRFYKPHNWIVAISDIGHIPYFSASDAKIFMTAYKSDKLGSKLEELAQDKNYIHKQLSNWYIREAIEDFFSKKIYSSYENEL
jgi:hypothetical protein